MVNCEKCFYYIGMYIVSTYPLKQSKRLVYEFTIIFLFKLFYNWKSVHSHKLLSLGLKGHTVQSSNNKKKTIQLPSNH